MAELRYKRVLLKISGEALMGRREFGLDPETVNRIAGEVKAAVELGTELCLVIGGGEHLSRDSRRRARHATRLGRLHGHAGDGHQRACHAERPGATRRSDPRAVRDSDVDGLRAVHPPARPAPS